MAQGATKQLDIKVGGLRKISQFALTLTFVWVGKKVFILSFRPQTLTSSSFASL